MAGYKSTQTRVVGILITDNMHPYILLCFFEKACRDACCLLFISYCSCLCTFYPDIHFASINALRRLSRCSRNNCHYYEIKNNHIHDNSIYWLVYGTPRKVGVYAKPKRIYYKLCVAQLAMHCHIFLSIVKFTSVFSMPVMTFMHSPISHGLNNFAPRLFNGACM